VRPTELLYVALRPRQRRRVTDKGGGRERKKGGKGLAGRRACECTSSGSKPGSPHKRKRVPQPGGLLKQIFVHACEKEVSTSREKRSRLVTGLCHCQGKVPTAGPDTTGKEGPWKKSPSKNHREIGNPSQKTSTALFPLSGTGRMDGAGKGSKALWKGNSF